MAAHDFTKHFIEQRLDMVGKAIIAAVGEQMGINKKACSLTSKRLDSIMFFPEVTIRYSSGNKTRFGEEKLEHFRNDGILFIRPGQWGLNGLPTKMKAFTVGLEIKENLKDLAADDKLLMYMGWTDFYFLMVPSELKKEALAKLEIINDARLGLLIYDGFPTVVRIPLRQDCLFANKYAIAMECLFFERKHREIEYELSGQEEAAELNPFAYQNAFRDLHPEFNGADDTWLKTQDRESHAMTEKELRTLATGEETVIEEQDRKEQAAQRKAAKLAREEALAEALSNLNSPEVKKRLVVQRNDAQTVYHAINRCNSESTITAEKLAEEIGISKRTVEASLASLRNAGLIRSEGSKKKPQIAVISEFEETDDFAKCSLFSAVKSPSERRRMQLVCSECPLISCPAHP